MENETESTDIGARVKYFRDNLNLSQEELSGICNLPRSFISQLESRSKYEKNLHRIKKVAEGLGVTVNDLVYSPSEQRELFKNALEDLKNADREGSENDTVYLTPVGTEAISAIIEYLASPRSATDAVKLIQRLG